MGNQFHANPARTPRVTGQLVRAANATQYAAGDNIGQSTTGSAVSAISFSNFTDFNGGGILGGAKCVVTAASGTIVISAFAFDLYVFRPETSIPFADAGFPADNAAFNVSAAAMKQIVGVFQFTAAGWRNQAGANAAAGDHVYQEAKNLVRDYAGFNVDGLSQVLKGMMQAQDTWNPGNVAQTFDFELDILGD